MDGEWDESKGEEEEALEREERKSPFSPSSSLSLSLDLRLIISNYDRGRLSAVPHGRAPSFDPFGTLSASKGWVPRRGVKARRGAGGVAQHANRKSHLYHEARAPRPLRRSIACAASFEAVVHTLPPSVPTCIDNFYPPPPRSTSLIESSLSGTTDCLTPLSHHSNPPISPYLRDGRQRLRSGETLFSRPSY